MNLYTVQHPEGGLLTAFQLYVFSWSSGMLKEAEDEVGRKIKVSI